MNQESQQPLDPKLGSLLSDLRSRVRRYITIDSLLAMVLVVTVAFWLGLLVDWGPVKLGGTEMPRSARAVLLIVAVLALCVVLVRFFLARIIRKLPDESLALLLERHHPHLAGRLITAVQLNRPRNEGDLYSKYLLDEVRGQAISVSDQVDPGRVFRWRPVVSKMLLVVPLLLGMIGLAVASPSSMKQAASRLLLYSDDPWPRKADLRMIGIEVPMVSATEQNSGDAVRLLEFEDRTVRVAKGGTAMLRIEARADDAVVPEVCTVYYNTAGGLRGQVNMRRVGRVRDGYQAFALDGPPLAGIAEDIELDIRGLDDRLDNYKIVAVDPPNISGLQVEARYPEYLRTTVGGDQPDLVSAYQPGLRIREGTTVRLVGRSSTPIDSVEAAVTRGDQPTELVPVEISAEGDQFSLVIADLRAPTSVVLVPADAAEITAPSPYRYFLGVVADSPPNVQLRLLGIGNFVTPDVRIPFEGTAIDDYAIQNLEIQLAPVADTVDPVLTRAVTIDRDGDFEGAVDIRDAADAGEIPKLVPGVSLNFYGEATDGYDLGTPHVTRTDLLRLDVVSVDDLLAALERRELALRSRLEQTISETRALRDSLDLLRREGWDTSRSPVPPSRPVAPPTGHQRSRPQLSPHPSVVFAVRQDTAPENSADEEPEIDRTVQLLGLRIQQASLQATKTSDELSGVAASIDDILLEMVNNRVDSPDRRQRIAQGVRDPLQQIVAGSLNQLRQRISGLLPLADNPTAGPVAATATVQTAEEVLLQLEAVLEKMLDLESYNEVLDLVRDLIDNQGDLIEASEEQRKQALQDLFKTID